MVADVRQLSMKLRPKSFFHVRHGMTDSSELEDLGV